MYKKGITATEENHQKNYLDGVGLKPVLPVLRPHPHLLKQLSSLTHKYVAHEADTD